MSRIGRLPIDIPAGVTVDVKPGNHIFVKGPKGELSEKIDPDMKVAVKDGQIRVERPGETKRHKSLHGLSRSLIANMVQGVTQGYEKVLEIVGVGYRAQLKGNKLVLNVGYSHPVEFDPPKGIQFEVPAQSSIVVRGINKQAVGEITAEIRDVRPPEPYKGKGIRYKGEYVRRKVGKTGI